MTKRSTTEEFVKRAKEVHGEKYDYSKVEYVNNKTKVCIICPEHGEFWQDPYNHLKGVGCPVCGKNRQVQKRTKDTDWFISRAKEIHGNKYDYTLVDYINNHTKVCIICNDCGNKFMQYPNNHLRGIGCRFCKGKKISEKKIKYKAGEVFKSNVYGDYEILERIDNEHFKVKFLNTGFENVVNIASISYGNLKDYKAPSVCNVGFIGNGDFVRPSDEKSYICWNSMLDRCYAYQNLEYHPSYFGAMICKEWEDYSNFKKWYDENYIDGFQIDKDILLKHNIIYSPETCCFVPLEINTFFASLSNTKRDLPLGVSYRKDKKKYVAQISFEGKHKNLGYFDSPEKAFNVYKIEKEKNIKFLAEKYKDKIKENVYNAMINYEIKIDD